MALQPALPFQGFTFGCDPELFVLNSSGVAVTAEGLLPGTKDEPFKVPKGAVQVDGMAAEFNIDPAESFEEFYDNTTSVMKTLKKMLPKGYKLAAVPSIEYTQEEWDKAPENAKILGCNPDFNAWTGSANPPPVSLDRPRLRTASGHLHIGWTDGETAGSDQHLKNCMELTRQLDWYLGAWSVQIDPDKDRRVLYGNAGACRIKPYGVEYRVLSNFWLKSKSTQLQVWNRMQKAIHSMRGNYLPELAQYHNFRLINSINTSTIDPILLNDYYRPIVSI